MVMMVPIIPNMVVIVPIVPISTLLSNGTHCVIKVFSISQNAFQISNKVVSPMMEEIKLLCALFNFGFVFALGFRGADGILSVLSDLVHYSSRKKKNH